MKTFYFNTGVRPYTLSNFPYEYHKKNGHVILGGTLQIPFCCEAPENATVLFLCNTPDLVESKQKNVVVREVFNTTMCSKYVYLRINRIL